MGDKYKKELEDIKRRSLIGKKLLELKKIGKKKGLLNVDQYKKGEENKLIDRIVKGRQLSDDSKDELMDKAKNADLMVNATMSKNTILQKLKNPKSSDYNEDRLKKIAKERGIALRGKVTRKEIIARIENPSKYYTIEKLKELARRNNIKVNRNIKRPDLIKLLESENIITPEPITEEELNLGVLQQNVPIRVIKAVKQKARNAREALINFKHYIKNLRCDFLSAGRLKKLQKTLEKKEKKAKEEHDRIFTFMEGISALQNFSRVYIIKGSDIFDGRTFLSEAKGAITSILRRNKQTKVKLVFNCLMERTVLDVGIDIKPFRFNSRHELNLQSTDENELYDTMVDRIEEEIQKVEQAEGTGWKLHSITDLQLHTVEYVPISGSSYIDLPKYLKSKKANINLQNKDDNKNFMWSILRALNPKDKSSERIDKELQSKQDILDMSGIMYPVKLQDITKFENLN